VHDNKNFTKRINCCHLVNDLSIASVAVTGLKLRIVDLNNGVGGLH
jgi:hypothetical protein